MILLYIDAKHILERIKQIFLQMKGDSRMKKYKRCALFALVGLILLIVSSNMLVYYLAGGFSRSVLVVSHHTLASQSPLKTQ